MPDKPSTTQPAKTANRDIAPIDQLVIGFDHIIRTISHGGTKAHRDSPAASIDINDQSTESLNTKEKKHIGGLMRINHTGEVCAQALYQGQALTAKAESIKAAMNESAKEEEDHLAWCEERLNELDSRPSHLNPLFYGLSFSIGALAGMIGDKWSLGFVAATEDQVCQHLRSHLDQLPEQDEKSRAILEQMLSDEQEHGDKARSYGGVAFNSPAKKLMSAMSKVMTASTYRI